MSEVLNGFEALEDRVLLAGNVTVSVNAAGALTITGDGANNSVYIVDYDNDGYYEIIDGDGSTTILDPLNILDNVDGEILFAPPVGMDVIVNMGAGNDTLYVEDSGVNGDLDLGFDISVNMGAGSDYVEIYDLGEIYFGNVSVTLGSGNDYFEYDGDYSYIDNLTVNGGAGLDTFYLDYLNVGYNLTLNGGDAADFIELYNVYVDYGTGVLSIDGGKGTDGVLLDSVYADHTKITMDGATDAVGIYDSEFYYTFTLKGGAKADYVEIFNSYFYGINTLKGGGGKDYLDIIGNGNFFSAATTIKSWKYIV